MKTPQPELIRPTPPARYPWPSAEREFVLHNNHGLHARAATRFVQTTSRFNAHVEIEKDGKRIDGKSMMSVLSLMAEEGDRIRVHSEGADAHPVLAALETLISNRFGLTE